MDTTLDLAVQLHLLTARDALLAAMNAGAATTSHGREIGRSYHAVAKIVGYPVMDTPHGDLG